MQDELDLEIAEFLNWREARRMHTTCDVCCAEIRWSSWAWVRSDGGDHVRACFDCLGRSVLLLPSTNGAPV